MDDQRHPGNEPPGLETPTANAIGTGAPGTITLGGTVYLVTQPTPADAVTIRKYLVSIWKRRNANPLAGIPAAIKDWPPHMQEQAIKEAVKLPGGNAAPTSEALMELVYDPEGAAFATWLRLRKNHPDVTLEQVQTLVNPGNVDDVLAQLMKATDLEAIDPNSPGGIGSKSGQTPKKS